MDKGEPSREVKRLINTGKSKSQRGQKSSLASFICLGPVAIVSLVCADRLGR